MVAKIADFLRQLPSAGDAGFEGLIADLLSNCTGQRFHIAKSGTQDGRDISTRHPLSNVIAVECKRYGENTALDQRELLGELSEACLSIPDLDLWVLVTSRAVSSQLHETLYQATLLHGIELRIIEDGDGTPSSLEVLCAHAPEIVINNAQRHSLQDIVLLTQLLKDIAHGDQFTDRLQKVINNFLTPLIGYDNWRVAQNNWLMSCFQSSQESRAHLGQILNIAEDGTRLIERRAATQQLNNWLSTWKDTGQPIAIIGEEGDGKTWAVASWIKQLITEDAENSSLPAVIFLSSAEIQSNNPHDAIIQAIVQQKPGMNINQVTKRIERWLQHDNTDHPLILLVLDGINERYSHQWWRELLEKICAKPWYLTIALIITCRSLSWNYFSSLRSLNVNQYMLPPYNDHELNEALAAHNLQLSDIPPVPELLKLARKARYFDLLIQHRQRISESGDFTVARLIYEDWRDRLQRKRNIPIDDNEFQNLLRELVMKYVEGEHTIRQRQIVDLLPTPDINTIEELRTSGIIQDRMGKFHVNEQYLIYGLAMLLVDQVIITIETGNDIAEAIAGWLEPQSAMDIKAKICEAAALRALNMPDIPMLAKTSLLFAWITCQNVGQQTATNISAYFQIDRPSYFALAEIIWSKVHNHPWGQNLLMATFLRWIRHSDGQQLQLWERQLTRWLGFVCRYGHTIYRIETDPKGLEIQKEITRRFGTELPADEFDFAGFNLKAIDDDALLRLGRVALALISHINRKPFLNAIAVGCIAEAIMGQPNKYYEFAWVIRSSPQPLWENISSIIIDLYNTNNRIALQAAYRLLSFIGNAEAHQFQKTFPEDLFPPNPIREMHRSDPCNSFISWTRQECEYCVFQENLDPRMIARKIKQYCIDPYLPVPDDIALRFSPLAETIDIKTIRDGIWTSSGDIIYQQYEAALCAYAPETLASMICRMARQADVREVATLRYLSTELDEYSLVFTQEEDQCIYHAWEKLSQAVITSDKEAEITEMFLFSEVLRPLDAMSQLGLLLNRPEKATNMDRYELYFRPILCWENILCYLSSSTEPYLLCRTLWYLSVHADLIPPQYVEKHILPLLSHENSLIRAIVLQIIYFVNIKSINDIFIKGSWAWHLSHCELENRFGSLILCEHGQWLAFEEITRRIYPIFFGYAVRIRGFYPEETEAFAKFLHQQWLQNRSQSPDVLADLPQTVIQVDIADTNVPWYFYRSLNDSAEMRSKISYGPGASWGGMGNNTWNINEINDELNGNYERRLHENSERFNEVIQQQYHSGNTWFANYFYTDALDYVVCAHPEMDEIWLMEVIDNRPDSLRQLEVNSTFYEALCEILLLKDPLQGIRLYQRLRTTSTAFITQERHTKMRLIEYALFRAPVIPDIQRTWEEMLEQCKCDQEILEIAILAQSGQGLMWLQSYANQMLQSDVQLNYMRAITIFGLLETDESFDLLTILRNQVPETWLRELVETSLLNWQHNAWAKHWFHQFLTEGNDIKAWAAFRLFLHCVDRRFWLWNLDMINQVGRDMISEKRYRFYKANIDTIERSSKNNEKSLANQLFGQKTMPGQVWPWLDGI